MMKIAVLLSLATSANAFVHPSPSVGSPTALASAVENKHNEQSAVVSSTRQAFLGQVATSSAALVAASFLGTAPPALATGRATLDVTYRRYAPRIRAGGEFYGGDFKSLVANNDWKGIQGALREVPERQKKDLSKSDGGVAERARQAGAFSDARVLVAAELFASAFSSQNAVSEKTRKMKAAVDKVRTTIAEMDQVTKRALGEDTGGLFGFGKKKASEAELAKEMRTLYAQGGTAWNEYVFLANENLALQFEYVVSLRDGDDIRMPLCVVR